MHKCSALFQYPDSSPTINQHKALGSNFRLTGFQSRMNFNYNFKAEDQLQLHSTTVSKILYQPNNTTALGNILQQYLPPLGNLPKQLHSLFRFLKMSNTSFKTLIICLYHALLQHVLCYSLITNMVLEMVHIINPWLCVRPCSHCITHFFQMSSVQCPTYSRCLMKLVS